MKNKLTTPIVSACIALLGASLASAQLINLDFNGGQYGSGAGATQSGAAVVGSAGDVWNGLSNVTGGGGGSGTDIPLVGANGVALTGLDGNSQDAVTLTYAVSGGFAGYGPGGNGQGNGFGDPNNGIPAGPDFNLMSDYFQDYGGGSTFTLNNLAKDTAYNVYVYSEDSSGNYIPPGSDGAVSQGQIEFTASGTGTVTLTPYRSLGTFVSNTADPDASNYGILHAMSDDNGTLSITAIGGSSVDFNGFQIESGAVPEPSTWALLLGGLLVLAYRTRRILQK